MSRRLHFALGMLLPLLAPATSSAESYTYDASGRLTGVDYDDGSGIRYTYDAAGNRLAMEAVDDVVPPVIALLGEAAVTVEQDAVYSDAGATATDNADGDLTASIVVGGTFVDTSTEGTFTITYDVSDAAGNAATQVVRTVTVVAAAVDPGPGDDGGDGGCGCAPQHSGRSGLALLLPLLGSLALDRRRRRRSTRSGSGTAGRQA